MSRKIIPSEILIDLARRLALLPARCHERRQVIAETAQVFGVSEPTLYRALAERCHPKALRRSDRGAPRVLPAEQLERYCELIAAIKVRTSNKKGRHLSTAESIRLIETFGIDTPDGHVQAPAGTLNKTTVNRYLKRKRPLNHVIDFQNEVVAVYEVFGSTSCQGSNASKSSTVLARGN